MLFAAAVGSDLSHPAPNTTQQQTMTKIRIDNTIFASTGMEQRKKKAAACGTVLGRAVCCKQRLGNDH
jgi:hypothetical protein